MSILQIKSGVPSPWKIKLKQCTMMPANIPTGNRIFINNKNTFIEKTSCKDLYWHIINTSTYTPTSRKKWFDHYPEFHSADTNVWPRLFKLPFETVRDAKIQTFQYRILHRIIPCNTWLHNIKIKDNDSCDYCSGVDDILHFFKKCPKVNDFG